MIQGAIRLRETGEELTPSLQYLVDEFEAEEAALKAIEDGQPRLLDFGVSNEDAWEVGLACGGKVQVYVEKLQ